jgi:acyl-CoA synthetase (AMP-forming)/AMP-acid ligase II
MGCMNSTPCANTTKPFPYTRSHDFPTEGCDYSGAEHAIARRDIMANEISNLYGPSVVPPESGCVSVPDLLRWQVQRRPATPVCAVVGRDGLETETITYGGLDRRARAVARHLQELGIAPGERALLAFPTGVDFLVSFFACAYAGVVAVPVPLPGADIGTTRLAGIVIDAAPSAVLTTDEVAGRASAYGLSGVRAIAVAAVNDELASEFRDPDGGYAADSPVFMQYTSGSTSTPKGVTIRHGNVLANLRDLLTTVPMTAPDGETLRIVSWLPLFHDMGLAQVIVTVFSGGMLVLISPTSFLLRPVLWLEMITRYRAHMATAPNFGYDFCSRRVTAEQRSGLDLSSWLLALNGSEPVRADTLDLFTRTFAGAGFDPASFVPCYGLAEGTFFVSGGRGIPGSLTVSVPALERDGVIRPPVAGESQRQVVSCGPIASTIDLRLVRPGTSRACPAGQVGEIWLAGASISSGYWRRDDERFARLDDDPAQPYLRTGDLGFMHDGELYVLGRHDDVIVLAGRNHYPQDIELTAQLSHPALAPGRVAAFSYQHDEVTAIAVVAETAKKIRVAAPGGPAADGFLDRAEVINKVRWAVSREHQIRLADVILLRPTGLPRTTSGKVQRRLCRELFLANQLKKW